MKDTVTIRVDAKLANSPEQVAREICRALRAGRPAGAVFVATQPTRWQSARDLALRAALRVLGALVVLGAALSLVREWLAWTR